MRNIFIALVIGCIAGIIDVVPMIIQKLDIFSCSSAFVHWIVLGLIIPYVSWNIPSWLKGCILAELTAFPIMIVVYPHDVNAIIPMGIFSAILGAGVGLAGSKFIGKT